MIYLLAQSTALIQTYYNFFIELYYLNLCHEQFFINSLSERHKYLQTPAAPRNKLLNGNHETYFWALVNYFAKQFFIDLSQAYLKV